MTTHTSPRSGFQISSMLVAIKYLGVSRLKKRYRFCNRATLIPCKGVVDRPPYAAFLIDEKIAPLLFDDVNGLGSALRYGCLGRGTSGGVDCLPCEDQAAVMAQTHEFDQVIIEWCCGHDSRLGRPSRYSQGCRVARLTIDDDFRTLDGLHKALEIAKRCPPDRTLLWSAMPCAGGSPLQRVNRARGVGIEKLNARWRDFYTLWGNFEIVAEEVLGVGGIVTIEWPEVNDYWRQLNVAQFLERFYFDNSIFRGCACRLVTQYGPLPGVPLRKSWRGSSDNSKMLTYLNESTKEVRDHKHGDNQGGDYEEAENDTPGRIDAIHMGFQLCCSYQDGGGYFYPKEYCSTDYITPCIDYDHIREDVANDGVSHGASHHVTSPRECALPSPEHMGVLCANCMARVTC
jgi:hypothetical protein